MATMNPFDLLVDDDNEDPNQLASVHRPTQEPSKKIPALVQPAKPAKLPSKPLPPAQAVREAKNENRRGRGSGRGFGRGRGGGGFNRDSFNPENDAFSGKNGFSERPIPSEEVEKDSERRGYGGPRGSFRGRRRGGFSNEEAEEGERPRRLYERRSGTGRGNEIKRDGAGRRNWGTPADEIAPDAEEPVVENEKNVAVEQQLGEDGIIDDKKEEDTVKEPEEQEPEDKEMTLKEYEKICEEKRKQLLALKTEVRKVDVDEELETMQQLSSKKNNDEIFVKLGIEKDKRKDITDKEEKAKKSVTINEFLKPADGERYYNPGGRGRGRGRGLRGSFNGGNRSSLAAPSIEDPGHFPSLTAK